MVVLRNILIGLLLLTELSQASVVYLTKDVPAPFAGYLFSPDMEKELRQTDSDATFYKNRTTQLETLAKNNDELVATLNKRVTLYQDQSNEFAEKLISRENSSFWHSLFYFVLGAASTTAIVFGVNKASK